MGRKLGDVVQYFTQFVVAFAVAFYYNWKLTLVLLSAFPFIALSGKCFCYGLFLRSARPTALRSSAAFVPQVDSEWRWCVLQSCVLPYLKVCVCRQVWF